MSLVSFARMGDGNNEVDLDVLLSLGDCQCSGCHTELPEGSGLMLNSCLHPFCRKCLSEAIFRATERQVKCPFPFSSGCDLNGFISMKEIKAALSAEEMMIYTLSIHDSPGPIHVQELNDGRDGRLRACVKDDLLSNGYHILLSEKAETCTYCYENMFPGSGIILQGCLHVFCRECLRTAIRSAKTAQVGCPIGQPDCISHLLDREIKSIANEDEFERYLQTSFKTAKLANIFNCKTEGCSGMCEVDKSARKFFLCPTCRQKNCLTCEAIHDDMSCEEFNEIIARGHTVNDAMEIAKDQPKSGWHQLYNYVSSADIAGAISTPLGTSHNLVDYYDIQDIIDGEDVLPSTKEFECSICLEAVLPREGIILKDCLHNFCRGCMVNYISGAEEATIKCPYVSGEDVCSSTIAQREVKGLVSPNVWDKYLERSIKFAELVTKNSFHCLTPNCSGWCEAEETATFFWCPVCGKENCIRCKAFHETSTCEQYKQKLEDDKNRNIQQENERIGEAAILASVENREFQRCPKCNSVCHKIDGCLHVTCAACKTPFNWRN